MVDRLLNKQVVGLVLAVGLGLLGLSLFVAKERWIALGGLRFQASEPLKFAIPLLCGVCLARTNGKVKIREHPFLLLITAGVAAAIAVHDLGSAALVLGTVVMLFFAAGADWKWLPAGVLTLGLFGGLYIGTEEYRIRRLDAWLAPWEQTNTNEGAQLTESLRAIHQGGLEGAGMGQGLRSQGYLAVDESDFVFAILAEAGSTWHGTGARRLPGSSSPLACCLAMSQSSRPLVRSGRHNHRCDANGHQRLGRHGTAAHQGDRPLHFQSWNRMDPPGQRHHGGFDGVPSQPRARAIPRR